MDEWSGKQVLILGLARQGTALARYLAGQGARVTVSDLRSPTALQEQLGALAGLKIEYVLGEHPHTLLDDCDLMCLSGGVDVNAPLPAEARRRGIALSNDAEIFLARCPSPHTVGITGSAGKTTTTTLVGAMLREQFGERAVWVGGNIGNPLIGELERIGRDDRVVLELSSFQLEVMTAGTAIAAVLNVTPNHLDRHGTLEAYAAAKRRLLENQSGADALAVLGHDDPGSRAFAGAVHGRLAWFSGEVEVEQGACLRGDALTWRWSGREQVVARAGELKLRGAHNVLNVLAAMTISGAAGAEPPAMRAIATTFTGVAHRLQLVREHRGVRWVNDSIATAPERAMAGIRAFDEPVILLAGGRDKKLPWESWAALVRERVRHVVLFGEAGDLIARALRAADVPAERFSQVGGLQAAVARAAGIAQAGEVVLLSPGGTGFDEFRDFEERGVKFARWVAELP